MALSHSRRGRIVCRRQLRTVLILQKAAVFAQSYQRDIRLNSSKNINLTKYPGYFFFLNENDRILFSIHSELTMFDCFKQHHSLEKY